MTSSLECNENDESDDFDANAMLLPLRLELCKKWRLALQNEVQSLREHDVCQEMTEKERWTILSKSIIPRERVFTIRSENTKKDQIVRSGNFQDDAGMAVSVVNVALMTVRV